MTFNVLTIDFTSGDRNRWGTVNDGVMGGLSSGRASTTEEGVIFFGNVSLENNGGFASFRGPYMRYDLSGFKTVTIAYRSTGMDIAFQLDRDSRFYLPNYKLNLPTSEEWTEVSQELTQMKQYRMGNQTGRKLAFETLDEIIRMGFITNEKRAGDFKFEVKSITFQ